MSGVIGFTGAIRRFITRDVLGVLGLSGDTDNIWNLPLDVSITTAVVNSVSVSSVSLYNIVTSSSPVYTVAITDSSRG